MCLFVFEFFWGYLVCVQDFLCKFGVVLFDLMVCLICSGCFFCIWCLCCVVGVVFVVVFVIGLSVCVFDLVSELFLNGENIGYVVVDGVIVEIFVVECGEFVVFGGVIEDGEKFDSVDIVGQVVVVNFWYVGCVLCCFEVVDFEVVWQEYSDDDVLFIGINMCDQVDIVIVFFEEYGVIYLSLIDVDIVEVKFVFVKVILIVVMLIIFVFDKQSCVVVCIIGLIDGMFIFFMFVKDVFVEDL